MSTITQPQTTFLRGGRRFWLTVLPVALAIGALAAIEPIAAVVAVSSLIVLVFSFFGAGNLVIAAILVHMLGEPWRLSYVYVTIGGINLFPNDMLTLALFAAVLLQGLRGGRVPKIPKDAISVAALLFLGYGCFALLRSIPIHGWTAVLAFRQQFFYVVLFFLVLAVMRDRATRRRLMIAVLVAGVGVALYGGYNLVTNQPAGWYTGSRTLRYLRVFQAMTCFFALTFIAGTVWSRCRPLWSFALAGLYLFGILVAQARSVWVAGFAAIVASLLVSRTWRRSMVRILLPLIALTMIAMIIAGPTIGDYVTTRAASLGNVDEDVTTLWRLFAWGEALGKLMRDPILGLGLGEPFIYFDVVRGEWEKQKQIHNSYIELAYYSGLVGVGLMLYFQFLVLFRTLWAARRCPDPRRSGLLAALGSCQVCLAGVAFANVVGASMVATTYVWILSAISLLEIRDAEGIGRSA